MGFMIGSDADIVPYGTFEDRSDAGRKLAAALMPLKHEDPIEAGRPLRGRSYSFRIER